MNISKNTFFRFIFAFTVLQGGTSIAQNIGDFVSLAPATQNKNLSLPSTHTFQKIIEKGDALTEGGVLPENSDFTGYVPIGGSSENGYLSINSEAYIGGVTILDINFNSTTKLWEKTLSKKVDFGVAGTQRNCSGTVTSWGTVITCEEVIDTTDRNSDGRNDRGWAVEINPVTKTVIGRLWGLGNMQHENISVHDNKRTVYEGADVNPGYLYKFVADIAQDLSSGDLYVYKGSKNGAGNWILINNDTPAQQNSTIAQSAAVGATIFDGIEDVEIGPDGYVYFAVKGENTVFRFQDSDPISGTTVPQMETFVGNKTYSITHATGTSSANWGYGPDNMAFDGQGNLWVLQDGDRNYIWVVGNNHTQANPNVRIFGRTPIGSEPTGITFSPDYRFLFLSIQHPNATNDVPQTDAAENTINFDKDATLVIGLNDNLGNSGLSIDKSDLDALTSFHPNPSTGEFNMKLDKNYSDIEILVSDVKGQVILNKKIDFTNEINLNLSNQTPGIYLVDIRAGNITIDLVKAIKTD